MKIAITGANGFVGRNLCKHLSEQGNEVFALIRKNADDHHLPLGVTIRRIDYESPISIATCLADTDVLIHNAGCTKANNFRQMLAANLGITTKIIRAINLIETPIQLVYISSQAASGPSYYNIPKRESDACSPLTGYGKSKLYAEKAIVRSCRQNYTIVRPCSVYGCGDVDFLNLFKAVQMGLSFQIGRQDKLLNMIHVSQLAAFISLCVQNPAAYGQIFFATDGRVYRQSYILSVIGEALSKRTLNITIPESLASLVFYLGDKYAKLSGKQVLLNRDKGKEIMAESWLADAAKAAEILHWNPEDKLPQYIKETAECYRELGWL